MSGFPDSMPFSCQAPFRKHCEQQVLEFIEGNNSDGKVTSKSDIDQKRLQCYATNRDEFDADCQKFGDASLTEAGMKIPMTVTDADKMERRSGTTAFTTWKTVIIMLVAYILLQ